MNAPFLQPELGINSDLSYVVLSGSISHPNAHLIDMAASQSPANRPASKSELGSHGNGNNNNTSTSQQSRSRRVSALSMALGTTTPVMRKVLPPVHGPALTVDWHPNHEIVAYGSADHLVRVAALKRNR